MERGWGIVSSAAFYALVTWQHDAFYQICRTLPAVIERALRLRPGGTIPHDTVTEELHALAQKHPDLSDDLRFSMAVYLLGFREYHGFDGEKAGF